MAMYTIVLEAIKNIHPFRKLLSIEAGFLVEA